jgi:hypothetical protein
VRAQRGTDVDTEDEEDLEDIQVIAKLADIGEGAHRPSWIWFQTSGREDMDDPLMCASKLFEPLCSFTHLNSVYS